MELQLGLGITMRNQNYQMNKKRGFDEAFSEVQVPQTLSLLVWDKQPKEEDDHNDVEKSVITDSTNDIEEDEVIGWPPINNWRKNFSRHNHGGSTTNYVMVENHRGGNVGGRGSSSKYVKVKMEGFGIARKIDLSAHHSYETLTNTLVSMFRKYQENVHAYELTYQDKEGDWLLAGDVPWGTFVEAVQRLKLVKDEH